MIAFEISHNGHQLFTAGVGGNGVLSAIVTWTLRDAATVEKLQAGGIEDPDSESVRLEVGGLTGNTHCRWPRKELCAGDEVTIRLCDSVTIDPPSQSHVEDPKAKLLSQQDYVRRMCRDWGWKITESE